MSESPVDELRQVLLARELDGCRTRFLTSVAKLDGEQFTPFEDIPQYCCGQLEKLVQGLDGVVVSASEGEDTIMDKVCGVTTTVLENGTREDIACGVVHDDISCEMTAVLDTTAAVVRPVDYTPEEIACENTAVVLEQPCTPKDTTSGTRPSELNTPKNMVCRATVSPAATPANHIPKDTARGPTTPECYAHNIMACETMAAVTSTAVSGPYTPKNTTVVIFPVAASTIRTYRDMTSEPYTPKNTVCKTMAEAVLPATASGDRARKDTACKPTIMTTALPTTTSESFTPKDTTYETMATIIPAAASEIHTPKDMTCKPVISEFQIYKDMTYKITTPATAFESFTPNNTTRRTMDATFEPYTPKDATFKTTAAAFEPYTPKNTVCKTTVAIIPAAASADDTPKDTARKPAIPKPYAYKDTACQTTAAVISATTPEIRAHDGLTCKTAVVTCADHTPRNTVHKPTPPELNAHQDAVCNITVATFPAAASANHTPKGAAREPAVPELYTCKTAAAVVPAATT